MLQLPSGMNLWKVFCGCQDGGLNPEESSIRLQHTRMDSRKVESEDEVDQKMEKVGIGNNSKSGIWAGVSIREQILPTL